MAKGVQKQELTPHFDEGPFTWIIWFSAFVGSMGVEYFDFNTKIVGLVFACSVAISFMMLKKDISGGWTVGIALFLGIGTIGGMYIESEYAVSVFGPIAAFFLQFDPSINNSWLMLIGTAAFAVWLLEMLGDGVYTVVFSPNKIVRSRIGESKQIGSDVELETVYWDDVIRFFLSFFGGKILIKEKTTKQVVSEIYVFALWFKEKSILDIVEKTAVDEVNN